MNGYVALTRTELRLFRREPFSIVFVLAFPLMMMMLLAAVFGNDQANAGDVENGMLVWRGVTPADYNTAASVASSHACSNDSVRLILTLYPFSAR